jgi:hypothetical protein
VQGKQYPGGGRRSGVPGGARDGRPSAVVHAIWVEYHRQSLDLLSQHLSAFPPSHPHCLFGSPPVLMYHFASLPSAPGSSTQNGASGEGADGAGINVVVDADAVESGGRAPSAGNSTAASVHTPWWWCCCGWYEKSTRPPGESSSSGVLCQPTNKCPLVTATKGAWLYVPSPSVGWKSVECEVPFSNRRPVGGGGGGGGGGGREREGVIVIEVLACCDKEHACSSTYLEPKRLATRERRTCRYRIAHIRLRANIPRWTACRWSRSNADAHCNHPE